MYILSCNKEQKFSILSLNCQSLNAKFDKLSIFLENLRINNFEFDAICLQETWLEKEADLSLFQIPNYTCLHQGKQCSQHGGLVIYLHKNYRFENYIMPLRSNMWEEQVVKVLGYKNEKSIYIYVICIVLPVTI